jgi:hypothetical protein
MMEQRRATDEDRRHFCSYDQALAGAPNDPKGPEVNGVRVHGAYVARNETTGHELPCADLLIAHGYVAASRAVHPNWVFALRVGGVRVDEVEHDEKMAGRLANARWRESEQAERDARLAKEWADE